MFGNYLIGLREGLEASLVVCILIAYLVKTERTDALKPIWAGIGVAIAVALGFGCALEFGSQEMTFQAQEARFVGGLANKAFDVSETIPPDSWYGTLLKGVFNFQPDPTVLQVTVWALYLVPTLTIFLAPVGFASGKGKVKAPDEQGSHGSQPTKAS